MSFIILTKENLVMSSKSSNFAENFGKMDRYNKDTTVKNMKRQVCKTLKDTPVVNSICLRHSLNNQLDDKIVLERELLKKYS